MSRPPRAILNLSGLEGAVRNRLKRLQEERFLERIHERDPSLWKNDPALAPKIRNRLGWLTVADAMPEHLPRMNSLAEALRRDGVRDVVVLGMGGSSLCPEVLRLTFGPRPGWPRMRVLDSTDPGAIRQMQESLDPGTSFFIVSSKSGTTTETDCFQKFFDGFLRSRGVSHPGRHFAAITDPGTPLERLGREEGYREVFVNFPDVGGRFSALTFFGLVPAALAGLDVAGLLEAARAVLRESSAGQSAESSPGTVLGAVLGEAVLAGRDKMTLITSPVLGSFGIWAEQLVAESIGKEGKGLIPVAGEPPGKPEYYGADRIFVSLEAPEGGGGADGALEAIEQAGHPVVHIPLGDLTDLGGEFLHWEIATAVAGSILGVNPFDEPNVQESKDSTRALLEEFVKTGSFLEEWSLGRDGALLLTGDGAPGTPREILRAFLGQIRPGDYFALLAYLPHADSTDRLLRRMRLAVRDRLKVATTAGYGPRYLHSTGQLHKGGPGSGVFLQIVADEPGYGIPIPGRPYGFSTLEQAQALGDFRSLRHRKRRALRVRLRGAEAGLEALARLVEESL